MGMITQTVIFQALVYGLLNGAIYALISFGLTMLFGVMRLVYFAYGQLAVFAMYISVFLYTYLKVDPFVSTILTAPLFFIIGILLYKIIIASTIKIPHHMQMMVTLGMLIFFENLMLFMFGGTPMGINMSYAASMLPLCADIKIHLPRFIAMLICVFLIIALFLLLKKSLFGKKFQATADNEEGAMLAGIETNSVFRYAFAIACALEGIAGSSIISFSVVDPHTGFPLIIKALLIVVVAGPGSIPGAIVGGIMVGIIEAMSSVFLSASLGTGILFFILACVLIFKPSGFFGQEVD